MGGEFGRFAFEALGGFESEEIVSTVQDRGYVEQQERRFVPTWLGETVNELMIKHFPEIVDINFTADMERKLDAVEEGKQGWTEFLKDFYAALRTQLERAETEMGRVQKPVEEANEACPECGKPLLIRSGRFGRGNFLLGLCLFFFELETDLSVFQFQVSRKGASFFGNKFVQEIGFSCRNEFLHLFFWNLAMQDVFTDAKGACPGRCDGIFASARTI